jgi:hypothetical protein
LLASVIGLPYLLASSYSRNPATLDGFLKRCVISLCLVRVGVSKLGDRQIELIGVTEITGNSGGVT